MWYRVEDWSTYERFELERRALKKPRKRVTTYVPNLKRTARSL